MRVRSAWAAAWQQHTPGLADYLQGAWWRPGKSGGQRFCMKLPWVGVLQVEKWAMGGQVSVQQVEQQGFGRCAISVLGAAVALGQWGEVGTSRSQLRQERFGQG